MTAQIPDTYIFEKKKYEFIAISEPIGFDPRDYGLKPNAPSTACWRGYWCEYGIKQSGLILEQFLIYNADGDYPPFNDIEPSLNERDATYRVHLKIDFTGKIVIGRGFINKYYVHGGFQRAWAFKEVKEIVFDKGNVIEVIDHSEEVKDLRRQYDKNPDKFLDDLVYDLSYDDTPAFLRDDSRPRSNKRWPWWLIP